MRRTLCLGLDGATFDVLSPLMEAGEMENLRSLATDGATAPLESTIPPVTGPAWLSLATGQTPGTTGIYDFIRRQSGDDFEFTYMNASVFRGRSVWDYLGEGGLTVGILDYPALSPPYPVEGFVSANGLLSVEGGFYPQSLSERVGDDELPASHLDLDRDRYDDLSVFLDDIHENLDRRVSVQQRLLRERDWDFAWAVLQEPDWVQHMMWHCFDDSHPDADGVSERDRQLFREFWHRIDELVGEYAAIAGEDANLVVQSDHGFGPFYDRSFRLNTWLKEEGYLQPRSFGSSQFWLKKRIRNFLSAVAGRIDLQERAPGLFRWGKNRTSSLAIPLNAVDLSETVAFDPGHIGALGGIYINDRALGERTHEDVIAELRTGLRQLADAHGLDIEVHTPIDLYEHTTPGAPDLVVYAPDLQMEKIGWNDPVIDDHPDRIGHMTGKHRRTGVLIAAGPDFRDVELDESYVWDVAPTLLHLFDQPVPTSMDGVVLETALTGDRTIERRSVDETVDERPLDERERENVQSELRDLGYM